jgi:hypothetical protein
MKLQGMPKARLWVVVVAGAIGAVGGSYLLWKFINSKHQQDQCIIDQSEAFQFREELHSLAVEQMEIVEHVPVVIVPKQSSNVEFNCRREQMDCDDFVVQVEDGFEGIEQSPRSPSPVQKKEMILQNVQVPEGTEPSPRSPSPVQKKEQLYEVDEVSERPEVTPTKPERSQEKKSLFDVLRASFKQEGLA